MRIGILALQGSVTEHIKMLRDCNVKAVEVRKPQDLENLKGLIIPGGESTTISKLMKEYKLDSAIKSKYKKGMAIYGSCAGAILLAKKIIRDNEAEPLGLIDIAISRNAYGRQVDSFEEELKIKGFDEKFHAVFIRAPIIESVHNGVNVIAEFAGKPVMARKEKLLVSTFHPELTKDSRIHEFFISMCIEDGLAARKMKQIKGE